MFHLVDSIQALGKRHWRIQHFSSYQRSDMKESHLQGAELIVIFTIPVPHEVPKVT